MELWWGSLSEALRWFYAIAISTSVLMVLQLLMMIFGFGDDLEDGADGDASGDGDVRVLSVRTVTAFFAGFGWTGIAAIESGASLLTALVLAILVGGVFMGGVIALMRALFSMRHSGTLDYRNAVGEMASVYLRIPANMDHPGQVEVMVQGRLRVVQALTRATEDIPTQARVRVVDTMDQNTLIVEPLTAGGATEPEEE